MVTFSLSIYLKNYCDFGTSGLSRKFVTAPCAEIFAADDLKKLRTLSLGKARFFEIEMQWKDGLRGVTNFRERPLVVCQL